MGYRKKEAAYYTPRQRRYYADRQDLYVRELATLWRGKEPTGVVVWVMLDRKLGYTVSNLHVATIIGKMARGGRYRLSLSINQQEYAAKFQDCFFLMRY